MIEITIRIFLLIVALGMQIYLHSFWFKGEGENKIKGWIETIFLLAAIVSLSLAIWRSWQLYSSWLTSPINKFLLPPYTSFSYFARYVGTRLFAPFVVSLGAALLGGYIVSLLNRRYEERFFEKEEPYFFALCILCAGYPTFLFFIILFFLVGLIWSAVYQVSGKGRAPLYYLWFPTAILAILIVRFYLPVDILASFNF
jgi:hypothetical protein